MANQYLYNLTDTWNNAGTTWDAIKMNVADSGSATASKLLDLQVGGTSKFKVLRDGDVTLTGPITGATTITMNGALSGATTIGMGGALTGATNITGSGTVTADRITVTKTTANAPAISSTGYSVTGSGDSALLDLAGTWDTTGAPIAIKLNVTDNSATPNVNSLLLDLQRGGVSQCKVTRAGALTLTGGVTIPFGQRVALSSVASFGSTLVSGYSIGFYVDSTNPIAQIQGTVSMFPSLQIGAGTSSSGHPVIAKDADHTLAQRNGTSAQIFNLYGTSSSSNANYERLSLISQAAGAFRIVTQKAGTGSAQALQLGTDGTTALTLTTAQKAEFAASIKTAAPTGGTAAEWKLGTVASVSPTSPDRTIEVDIGGTIYYIHAKTTNN